MCRLIDMTAPAECNVSLKILKKTIKVQGPQNQTLKNVVHEDIHRYSCSWSPQIGLIGKDSNKLIEGITGNLYLKEIQNLYSQTQTSPYEGLYLL